jgi:ABC-2 type transport system ATP-binding protein
VPSLEVQDLVVRLGTTTAVNGASLSVEAGEVVALLGPNGAGKTTTVRALIGERRPARGRVRVLGLDPEADHGELVRRVGVMPQGGGVYPGIRALEVLRLFAAYYDGADEPDALLARVGLADRAPATWRTLSGGEQQRLSLALALVGRPEVALLDEPTAGVDVAGRAVVREVVAELRSRGVAVLVTTHELDDAERMADRIVILDRGAVVADGTPTELRTGGAEGIRFAAPAGLDVAALGAHLGAAVREVGHGEYAVDAAPTPATVARLTAWLADRDLPLGDLRAGRARLEDVFLRLTGEGHR